MSEFITELSSSLYQDNDRIWILDKQLIYKSDLVGKVVVPVRFITDFASVPRFPIIYSLWGARAHREAVIHDYLFRSNSRPEVSFSTANKVFLEAMKCRGKPAYIRYPMYWGVCIGSFGCFHKRKVMDTL